jgi:putative FmdB family regulatory protein
MPVYEFECKKCKAEYSELSPYDPSGKYPDVECPKCGSKKKEKLVSLPATVYSQGVNETFTHKAGRLMERAKGERRAAEAASHMGGDPYNDPTVGPVVDDFANGGLDEGIHHPFPLKD